MYPPLSLSEQTAENLRARLADTRAEFVDNLAPFQEYVDIAQRAIDGNAVLSAYDHDQLQIEIFLDSWERDKGLKLLAGGRQDLEIAKAADWDRIWSVGDPKFDGSIRLDGLGFNILTTIGNQAMQTQHFWYGDDGRCTELFERFQFAVYQEIGRLVKLVRKYSYIWNSRPDVLERASPAYFLRWANEKQIKIPWVSFMEEVVAQIETANERSEPVSDLAGQDDGEMSLQEKRELVLKGWLGAKGIKEGDEIAERQREVWDQLTNVDQVLFPPKSQETIGRFFKQAKLVRFKRGRRKG
ncbi:MAG: hypothetical protein U5R46_02265 [Gammaproteobacteria bacterium]|nr:hypothetical protein [Gammaproteobacteria bacterium]